jgi:hypothetical protein
LPSAIDASTGLGTLRISLDKGPVASPVGAFGEMQVIIEHHKDTMLIPASALRGAMVDGPEVVICKDGAAHVRSMQVGAYDEKKVQVLGGLDASEFIAVDHVLGLSDDTPIRQLP